MSSDREDMAIDSGDGGSQPPVITTAAKEKPRSRLRHTPIEGHVPENYDDLKLEYSSCILRSLEKYLPPEILALSKDEKAKYMSNILRKFISRKDIKAQTSKEKREKIMANYQPRNKELYERDPKSFLLPSFRDAISENTEESIRRVISEPYPGFLVLQMFQPEFFEKLLEEVEHFKKWASEIKYKIRRPNKESKYGVVLDDLGLESMLTKIREDFIFPVCKVFFPDLCEGKFDSHSGLFVEYGKDRDAELGIHMEDSEITVNVCLSKQSEGGDLYFRGKRCESHVDSQPKAEECFDYCHVPGQAIIHRGLHSHGARAATSGHRANMLLWCKSSFYRELQTYLKEFPEWCGQCAHEKKEKDSQILAARRKRFFRIESGAKAQ